ncbi:hypothetical protein SLA2020_401360 [Shorea laevis]
MGEELQFQQRWEFRRTDNDFDSSSNESKPSSEPVLKKHKLVSSLIPLDDEETSETSRLQRQDNENPGMGVEIKSVIPKRRQTRKRSGNLRAGGMKSDSHEEVDRTKPGKSAYDFTALEDVKSFMGSLIEDLKVARENLSKWMREEMQKLAEDDDSAPQPKRRRRNCKVEKVQLQKRKRSERNTKGQSQKTKKSMQLQNQNNFEESILAQPQENFEEPVYVPKENNFQNNIPLLPQKDEKVSIQPQTCNGRSLERFTKISNATDSINFYRALEDRGPFEPIASLEKDKGEKLLSSEKSNLLTGSTNQNVQVQSQNSIVLAIEAQNSNGRSLERKGKKTVNCSNHYQGPENRVGHGQATRAATSGEKTSGEKLGSSVEPNFLSFGQVPSSMYLQLPTVFTEPCLANYRLDASSCNYILPRVAEKKTSANLEKLNQLLDPNGSSGYFPGKQPEERIRSFAQMGSGNIGCFNPNTMPTSSIGAGFPVPLHQGLDVGFSIPNQVNMELLSRENINTVGLRTNGGALRFSGGSYNTPPEPYIANNQHNYSSLKTDGRLLSYQITNISDARFSQNSFNTKY